MLDDMPSPFVVEWVPRVALLARHRPEGGDMASGADVQVGRTLRSAPTAIDLAMGRGRHSRLLARAGFRTFGVDIKLDAVRDAVAGARSEGLIVRGWCGDLTST